MAKIAFVVGPDFEDSEFRIPYDRLSQAKHKVTVLGTKKGETVKGKGGKESVKIEDAAQDHRAEEFDALVIPGGYSPDHLRLDEGLVRFVREFSQSGKPVAAICHGPQLLIEADSVRGRRVTSWPSVRKDLQNAGANWVDQQVVEDGNIITSRNPGDLDAFSSAILRRLGA